MTSCFGQEQADPTSADEGNFLSEKELLAWEGSMQKKYPTIFTPEDDKLFGETGKQHGMGTKLVTFLMMIPTSRCALKCVDLGG
jgi:hypothetical protein